jgi:hypothetical protein
MSNDSLAIITDRLFQKYGPEGVKALKTASFTREQLLDPKLDADRYAYLVATRPDEVDTVLSASQTSAQAAADAKAAGLKKFYDGIRSGVNTSEVVALWLKTNFGEDFEAFKAAYPQTAPSHSVWDSNIAQITALVAPRFVAPTYDELVRSYQYAMNPPNGSMPKLNILCPDGTIRTGKPLKDAVNQWPLELLDPVKKTAPVQSADEFLREHPELKAETPTPALLMQRFNNEFQRFLASDTGRIWRGKMDALNYTEESSSQLYDYIVVHGLTFHQKNFEVAAIAVADRISVNINKDDVAVRASGTIEHYGGGNRQDQLYMGLAEGGSRSGGRAGMTAPGSGPDTHEYSAAEVKRLVRKLDSRQYLQLMNDSPNFKKAVDKFLS